MKMKKIIAIILTTAFAVTALAACAGSNSAPQASAPSMMMNATRNAETGGLGGNNAMAENMAAQYDMAAPQDIPPTPAEAPAELGGGGVAGPTVTPVLDSRKIIKNVNLQLQTLTFDSGVDEIAKAAESFGGYVQDSYVEGRDMYNTRGTRTANFTLRVPSERLDAFVGVLGGQFNVISKSQNSQDITDVYFDSKARLDALKVQEERLLTMLQGATELEYMLKVETELMNVRYEIESLTSALKRMDGQVSLSTVSITLYEVVKYEPVENVPVTFAERISRAFSQSLVAFSDFSQDFTVAFVSSLPFLLLLAVIAVIIILAVKNARKSRAKRKQQNRQPAAQNMPNAPAEKPAESEKD